MFYLVREVTMMQRKEIMEMVIYVMFEIFSYFKKLRHEINIMALIFFCSPAILRNTYRTPQRNNIPGLYLHFLVLQNILHL